MRASDDASPTFERLAVEEPAMKKSSAKFHCHAFSRFKNVSHLGIGKAVFGAE